MDNPIEPRKSPKPERKPSEPIKKAENYLSKPANVNASKEEVIPEKKVEKRGRKSYTNLEKYEAMGRKIETLNFERDKLFDLLSDAEKNIVRQRAELENQQKLLPDEQAQMKIIELQDNIKKQEAIISDYEEQMVGKEYQIKNLTEEKIILEEQIGVLKQKPKLVEEQLQPIEVKPTVVEEIHTEEFKPPVLEERPMVSESTPSYMRSTGAFIGAGILTSLVANVISHGIDDITDRFFKKDVEPTVIIEKKKDDEKKQEVQPVTPITINISQEQRQTSRAIGKNYAKKIYQQLKNERRN